MAKPRQTRKPFNSPQVFPGEWRGEIVGGGSLNFGQVVQDGPPRQSVEFSYLILPVTLAPARGGFTWPGVVMFMAPTPMKPNQADAGSLLQGEGLPSLTLSLNVTRAQFSDILRVLETHHNRGFHFTVEPAGEGRTWPVKSWGIAIPLPRT